MCRIACFLAAWCFIGSYGLAWSQDKTPQPPKKVPDGVYAVLRESLKEKDVLPLKEGEVLLVHEARYLKKEEKEPPRYSLGGREVPTTRVHRLHGCWRFHGS
jgi:hypothetical protein